MFVDTVDTGVCEIYEVWKLSIQIVNTVDTDLT